MRRSRDALDIIRFDLGEYRLDRRGVSLEIGQIPTDDSEVRTCLGDKNTDAETECQKGMQDGMYEKMGSMGKPPVLSKITRRWRSPSAFFLIREDIERQSHIRPGSGG